MDAAPIHCDRSHYFAMCRLHGCGMGNYPPDTKKPAQIARISTAVNKNWIIGTMKVILFAAQVSRAIAREGRFFAF